MELEKLLMLLNLPDDVDKDELTDYLDEKIFDIKKVFLQPGFMFKKYYSKINQLERLEELYLYINENKQIKTEYNFVWTEMCGSIHIDYPQLYQSKIQWNMLFQSVQNPAVIKEMIANYELQIERLASSWVSSVNTAFIDEHNELFVETKLNQLGDPTAIYKGLEKIKEKEFKETDIFTKFGNDDELVVLLKEIIKAYKFLKAVHGRSIKR